MQDNVGVMDRASEIDDPITDESGRTLVRFRWWGLGLALLHVLSVGPDILPAGEVNRLLMLPAWYLVSQLGIAWLQHRGNEKISRSATAAILLSDELAWIGTLYSFGGSSSPFVYVLVAITAGAATMLPRTWMWLSVGLAISTYGILMRDFVPLPEDLQMQIGLRNPRLRVFHWLLFAVINVVVAQVFERFVRGVQSRQRALDDALQQLHRKERGQLVTALAATAAHELGTPLATISTAANELQRTALRTRGEERSESGQIAADAELIIEQTKRARKILDRLAGFNRGHEGTPPISQPSTIQEEVETELGEESRRIEWKWKVQHVWCFVSLPVSVLMVLLRNALRADKTGVIEVEVCRCDGGLQWSVRDRGIGMSTDQLANINSRVPSRTENGADGADRSSKGMGLGVLLSQMLVQSAGGYLHYELREQGGVEAKFWLPEPKIRE